MTDKWLNGQRDGKKESCKEAETLRRDRSNLEGSERISHV